MAWLLTLTVMAVGCASAAAQSIPVLDEPDRSVMRIQLNQDVAPPASPPPAAAALDDLIGPPPRPPSRLERLSPFDMQQDHVPGPETEFPELFKPRHVGKGHPLEGTSWLNRPYHMDWFAGTMMGSDLINGEVSQSTGLFVGTRLGYDFDHYWGGELRFGWARNDIADGVNPNQRENRHFLWDADVLYYPWGDARFRPFLLAGVGLQSVHFGDQAGRAVGQTMFSIPLGGGLKYQWRRWLAFRFDLLNNIAFGSGRVSTMGNWSLTFGMEGRFGHHRQTDYYPW